MFTGLLCTLKSLFLAPKMFFLINFIIILWFIWDLGLVLFDIHKDVVSGKIFWFWRYLPPVNWTQKWPKPSTLDTSRLSLKHLILEYFSETVFLLWKTYLWLKFQQTQVVFGRERAQKPPKRGHFMDGASPRKHLKIYNLAAANATLMKLTTII